MRIAVKHSMVYRYSAPVFLGPQVLRIKPRSDVTQLLLQYDAVIRPEPETVTENSGLDGNSEVVAWFKDETPLLSIDTTFEVETLRTNPFDFLWLGDRRLPLSYGEAVDAGLLSHRVEPLPEPLQKLASEIAVQVGEDAQAFPGALAAAIHATCRQIKRLKGDPRPPEETLARRSGSCRDLTVLYNAIARSAGFAARFVSGFYAAPDNDRFELHAWSELYLPGGGWRGFDPSAGLAASDRHVAVASGPSARDAAPISGAYYGDAATSKLAATVEIEVRNPQGQLSI